MLKDLAEVWRFRELLRNMVIRDIRVRYKNSSLGFFWSFLLPAAQVTILTVVIKYIIGVKIPNYSAYLLCSILAFNFFSQSVLESSTSILAYAGLVKKTYFPREILPAAVVISNLLHFILAMIVFFLYVVVLRLTHHTGEPAILVTWLLLPVVILINFMLNLGLAFYLSCLNTYYEDVKYIVTVMMNLIFYLLPIVYPVELAIKKSESHHSLLILAKLHFYGNPLSYLLIAYRKLLLPAFQGEIGGVTIYTTPFNYMYLGLAALTSFLILVSGYAYFNKRKWYFAERI